MNKLFKCIKGFSFVCGHTIGVTISVSYEDSDGDFLYDTKCIICGYEDDYYIPEPSTTKFIRTNEAVRELIGKIIHTS